MANLLLGSKTCDIAVHTPELVNLRHFASLTGSDYGDLVADVLSMCVKGYLEFVLGTKKLQLTERGRAALRYRDNSPDEEEPRAAGEWRYVLLGREKVAGTLGQILIDVLEELNKIKPGFIVQVQGGAKRPWVAQTKESLFPGTPHMAERRWSHHKLSFGWYVDLHQGKPGTRRLVESACKAAGVQFGKEVALLF